MTANAAPIEHAETHLTTAVIDLARVRANVRALKRCAPNALLQVVVKANAYGHGAVPVARAALEAGADWLGVYAPAEGIALREAGIAAQTLVFGPFTAGEARRLVDLDLTPTVFSAEGAALLRQAAAGREVPYHLKVDTGLSRSGICPDEAIALLRHLRGDTPLRLEGIYTHFASADEADKALTRHQLAALQSFSTTVRSMGIGFQLLHAANSAAALDVPASHLDMVRCGIATYGYYPSEQVSRDVPLLPVLSLVSTLTRVHTVGPGEGVGYAHEHRCAAPTEIGLVPVGYGDGLLRSLGNGRGRVIVGGKLVPVIGRVSMDQITVDVSGLGARAGDRVTLIGSDGGAQQTADELAAQAGTISYDVLSKLLPRVPRVYTGGTASTCG